MSRTVIVTDGKYRSSIAAVRGLGRAGWNVIVVQAQEDCRLPPPVFTSRYAAAVRLLPGHAGEQVYLDALHQLCRQQNRPVLFCIGAATLNAVAKERNRFREVCDFLIAPPEVLDALNDKESVHRRALELGLPVPREYQRAPERYPVVVKPHCGEKFGLKAQDRYRIAENETEYRAALEALAPYDTAPIVQEKVSGDGFGASLLLDGEGRLICALCHRRIREYPIAGGPSACCESVYAPERVDAAYRLLRSFGFVGAAMVEFKGGCILEVNPRIWGSFPLTEQAGSPFVSHYARAASGEQLEYDPKNYRAGVRMRFLFNDSLASLSLLKNGRVREGLTGLCDFFRVKEALSAQDDPAPLRRYLRHMLLKR